jgi:hypothetical protein
MAGFCGMMPTANVDQRSLWYGRPSSRNTQPRELYWTAFPLPCSEFDSSLKRDHARRTIAAESDTQQSGRG